MCRRVQEGTAFHAGGDDVDAQDLFLVVIVHIGPSPQGLEALKTNAYQRKDKGGSMRKDEKNPRNFGVINVYSCKRRTRRFVMSAYDAPLIPDCRQTRVA